jgi:hypothetical protein
MTSQGIGPEHRNKCGHSGCGCLIRPSDHFCSEHCAKADQSAISGTLPGKPAAHRDDGTCGCGHPECHQ